MTLFDVKSRVFFVLLRPIRAKKASQVNDMNHIKGIFLLMLCCAVALVSPAQESQDSCFLHTVLRGQSLYSIASMYNVSVDDIVRMNPGSEKQIRTGETLRIPQQTTTSDGRVNRLHYHTIQPGETLYRISQMYKVSDAVICRANPGLSAANFRAGQVIVIPLTEQAATAPEEKPAGQAVDEEPDSPCREMHKVKRKETVFSISREYGISEKELLDANPDVKNGKLKRGMFLCIPHKRKPTSVGKKKQSVPAVTPTNEELFNRNQQEVQRIQTIDVAVMLPFLLDSRGGEQTLMVEYYEGLLLAVDSLKRQNVNIDLHVYDTGDRTASLDALLSKPELKEMDIIFGPGHSEHIKAVSDFAKAHDIRLVIPFTSKDSEVFNNPRIYQINTPQSYLFSQVYKLFADNFAGYNVVFIEVGDEKDKTEYIKGMKLELDSRGIAWRSLPMPDTQEDVVKVLDAGKPNILIPTSGSNVALIKLLPVLQLVCRTEDNPYELHLFGYPEWQKYYNDHLQAFYELDTYFYSSFYTNNLLEGPKAYHRKFRQWYNKEMANTFPKYGMLGFDTAYFFLKGLSRYGSNLEERLGSMDYIPVQTGFHFERVNNWGGFINKKVFFVHMTRNHELIKLDFAQ